MKHKEKKRQENKGITLIALVVTIVVLIILATVSINAVLGQNGLIKKIRLVKCYRYITEILQICKNIVHT